MVTEAFANWATGFSGCDGGEPSGETWLCGIEFGGAHTVEDLLFEAFPTPGFVGDATWGDTADKFLTFPYNLRAVKLLQSIAGNTDPDCHKFFHSERCFQKHSNYFKLNLFPIAFPDTSAEHWHEWIQQKTGFGSKSDYIDWCYENRFPILREWVRQFSPKLIVCTGITYRADFFKAFGVDGEISAEKTTPGKHVEWSVTNEGKTVVAVTYFLGGPHGLISNVDLASTGVQIRKIRDACLAGTT
jgi:hypothetical protein